ncbi:streptogrisin C [Myxococcus fulvus]|uniref:Streptogrisin C n=1 Tax=Myxococcus fulvus TaxID=33 RepID=A0A511T4Z7_MYXFU|nr:S1 family peptidase [Myxococcus fulvus]GEN09225.1 hypothetical protein MFU01_42620 [Myxococcus fulvus]SEU16516.1 streptogrisin C [Myxococcus fulvus]
MNRRQHVLWAATGLFTTLVLSTSALAKAEDVSAEVLTAMQRDLGLTAEQVRDRLENEAFAARTERTLRGELGDSFAGAWLSETADRLIVGVTTAAGEQAVRRAGAEPRWVRRTERELDALKESLDRGADVVSKDIHGWYVDLPTNSVVVLAQDTAAVNAERFIAESGVRDGAVRVVISREPFRPRYDVRGGDAYYINSVSTRCTIGFAVDGGFITAGHCAAVNSFTLGNNGVIQGIVRGSSFPINDYGWVQVSWDWIPRPWVYNYAWANVPVAGSAEAGLNTSVCRSGSSSGWHCGTITSKNFTANYAEGPVYGLTFTRMCAEHGDSGGPVLWGNQAQGVVSGGSGTCAATGGHVLFQPVNEILSAYGLSLTTQGASEIVGLQGSCIDVAYSSTANGTPLQLWTCNSTDAQKWSFLADGSLRAFGKCMDVTWSSSTSGTPLQLWDCNGSDAQKFSFSDAGELVNRLTQKCVTVESSSGGNGARLQIWECIGAATQKWQPR